MRGGFNAFDKKQIEACIALNLTKFQMYKDIILPQILRNTTPMLINEFSSLIKESSILSIFGVEEIMMKSNMIIAETYDYYTPIISAAFLYYIICFGLERIGKYFEKKYSF
jgi:polar amino acid transport system permease protein